ncbi:MAG TPA: hypothetical protein VKV20_15915 [Ktedonobacteraceae bacterium]|nr:hypothetical protein [Ktedonobacteraceae bacterium]
MTDRKTTVWPGLPGYSVQRPPSPVGMHPEHRRAPGYTPPMQHVERSGIGPPHIIDEQDKRARPA